jgi:hypothetical protein
MKNNKQQTAVDLFWNQLPEILPFTVDTETAVKLQKAYQQAKEMEKEQIIHSYNQSWHFRDKPYETAEKHFNETYGGGKQ